MDLCIECNIVVTGRQQALECDVVVVVCHDQVRLQVSQGFRCRDS